MNAILYTNTDHAEQVYRIKSKQFLNQVNFPT